MFRSASGSILSACSAPSRLSASLQPRGAGLTAWTAPPRAPPRLLRRPHDESPTRCGRRLFRIPRFWTTVDNGTTCEDEDLPSLVEPLVWGLTIIKVLTIKEKANIIMSYRVTCTFDLEGASNSDYENAKYYFVRFNGSDLVDSTCTGATCSLRCACDHGARAGTVAPLGPVPRRLQRVLQSASPTRRRQPVSRRTAQRRTSDCGR